MTNDAPCNSPSDSYGSSGVHLDAMEALKDRIKAFASATHGPEVLNAQGGFAGMYQLAGYKQPVLVASADGVGTKLKIAGHLGHFESVGQDLVSLNVNDILTKGAKPIFFLDYVAFSDLDEQRMDSLIRGIAWGCRETGCALLGGETAQMPGLYRSDDMDLAGFVVGVAERDGIIDGATMEDGDVLVGIPSSGVHTNGFSLVRQVFNIDENPTILFQHYAELQHQLGEELLIRHRCYYPVLAPVFGLLKGLAHITGGGIPGKMPSVISSGLAAQFDTGSWSRPAIFDLIQQVGGITREEMYRVVNMGLGMVAVCGEQDVPAIQQAVSDAVVVGRIVPRRGDDQVWLLEA